MSYIRLIILLFLGFHVAGGCLHAEPPAAEAMVPITVKIDFGPAEKPSVEQKISIKEGATPNEALKAFLPVEQGAICCDAKEIKTINGVAADPVKNRWWRLKINGTSKNASPYKSHLKAGDVMEWIYFEDAQ